jgi:HEAT repeat protein
LGLARFFVFFPWRQRRVLAPPLIRLVIESVDRAEQPDLTSLSAASATSAAASRAAFLQTDSEERGAEQRRELIRQLLQQMDPHGIRKLLPLLQDPNANVRREAAQALELYGWRPVSAQEQARRAVALGLFEEVMSLGAAAVEPLCTLLLDRQPAQRLAGLEMLIQLEGVPPVELLAAALQDEETAVRLVAVQAVAKVGGPHAARLLAGVLSDPNAEVRTAAVEALGRCGCAEAVAPLTRVLGDPAPELRGRAAELLGRLGETGALSALAGALLDEEGAVREAAFTAIQALAPGGIDAETTAAIFPALESACGKGNPESRLTAQEILKRLGHAPCHSANELGGHQLAAVMALAGAIQAPNRDLRQGAAEALGRLGDLRGIASLTKALGDRDEWVRRAALYALHDLGWQPANYPNLAQQAVILHRWDVACACGEAAVGPLLLALDSSDPAVQVAVIQCLSQLGSPQAMEPLAKRLQAGAPAVRRAAAAALGVLGWQSAEPRLAVRQAIAREGWDEAARHGTASVELLVQAVKESAPQAEQARLAAAALATVADPQAAGALLAQTRDGQVAAAAVQALRRTLEAHAARVEAAQLHELAQLCNVFQFQYAFDARYGTQVRTAMQEVDTLPILELAQRELARRQGRDHLHR